MSEKNKIYQFPAVIAVVSLFLAVFPWPYAFYGINRVIVTVVVIYYAWLMHELKRKKDFYFWGLIFLAVLFNPVLPVHLYSKGVWGFVDVIAVIFLIVFITKFKKK